jgi:hypothetical protein
MLINFELMGKSSNELDELVTHFKKIHLANSKTFRITLNKIALIYFIIINKLKYHFFSFEK